MRENRSFFDEIKKKSGRPEDLRAPGSVVLRLQLRALRYLFLASRTTHYVGKETV